MVTERTCCVCGEALGEDDFFQCNYCYAFFHLASAGPTGKECGSFRAAEGQCGLVFVCGRCAGSSYDTGQARDQMEDCRGKPLRQY